MKLTHAALRRLIKEEIQNLAESDANLETIKSDVSNVLDNFVKYKRYSVASVISAVYAWANEKNADLNTRSVNKAQDLTSLAAQLRKQHGI
jgi:hypothetical protein